MERTLFPEKIPNWINGREQESSSGELFDKLNPANGKLLSRVARSNAEDVVRAVIAAKQAQPAWAGIPAVQRGMVLHDIVKGMQERQEELAQVVAVETRQNHTRKPTGKPAVLLRWGSFMPVRGSGYMAELQPAVWKINMP